MLVPHAANWLSSGRTPGQLGSADRNMGAYDKVKTGDGELFLGVVNDGQFRRFCRLIDREDLASDPRFQTNPARVEHRGELRAEIERALAGLKVEEICGALMKNG